MRANRKAPALPRGLADLIDAKALTPDEEKLARAIANDEFPDRFIAILDRARVRNLPRHVMMTILTAIYLADAELRTIEAVAERMDAGYDVPIIVKTALAEIRRLHAIGALVK